MKNALSDADKKRAKRHEWQSEPVKIKMLVTKSGSPDGITLKEYQAGEIHEVPRSLASAFVNEDWAAWVKK